MQKGRRLFDELNYDSSKISKYDFRGRSKILIEERNRCLCFRYWYYSKRHKNRYDDVLKCLSKEFYLSEMTVTNLISKNSISIKRVYEENPKINELKIEFDYLTWK